MSFSFKKLCSQTIPVGTYKGVVADIKFDKSASGKNMLVITMEISDGAYKGRKVIDRIVEDAFSFKLMPFLNAAEVDTGREYNTISELYDYGIVTTKGKEMMFEVTVQTYQGSEYNNIKTYTKLVGASTVTLDQVSGSFDLPDLGTPVAQLETAKEEVAQAAPVAKPTIEAPSVAKEEAPGLPEMDFNIE